MYSKVLVGYDGSEGALDALALAHLLAAPGDSLIAASVFTYLPWSVFDPDRYFEELRSKATDLLGMGSDGKDKVRLEISSLAASSTADGLHELAEIESADMIVLGSSGRSAVGRVFAGSVAESFLHGSPCPVAVAPRDYRKTTDRSLRRIGIAFDGSPEAEIALSIARDLAIDRGAQVEVIGVCEPLPPIYAGVTRVPPMSLPTEEMLERQRNHFEQVVTRAVEALPSAVRAVGVVLVGEPAEELQSKGDQGVDLLVMGSRGYGPIRKVLLGGLAGELMRSAPCPVLVLPRGAKTERQVQRLRRETV